MNGLNQYFNIVSDNLKQFIFQQQQTIHAVAKQLKNVIANDGVIYIFGCGHSHIFAEDVFYRAGGLAVVRPLFIEPLMLHQGAALSSQLEKQTDYISPFLDKYPITSNDALIVISTSGINPAPIDVALWGQKKGALTLALTSLDYARCYPSKHRSGRHLADCADWVIDNQVPLGDAVLQGNDPHVPFAPLSSVMGIFIIQALFAQTVCELQEDNISAPVFLSGNIPGSQQHNHDLLKIYGKRIPELMSGL